MKRAKGVVGVMRSFSVIHATQALLTLIGACASFGGSFLARTPRAADISVARRQALGAAFLLLLMASVPNAAHAQQNLRLAEAVIKVGLIYHLLSFTEWPPGTPTGAPFEVCVYGDDPFQGRLSLMENRLANQRAIRVHAVRSMPDLRACSLVFLNGAERGAWPAIRSVLAQQGVLTVSDMAGFADDGGMVEFTHTRDRIGLRFNTFAMTACRLSVQERLLRLAETPGAQP